MNKTLSASLVGLICLSGGAFAAQQGQLGTTSTGSLTVTAQGPVAPRLVQVTGLTDPTITNSSRSEIDSARPGATTTLCLVDTYAGRLNLNIASANGASGNRWVLRASSNQSILYQARLTDVTNQLLTESGGNAAFDSQVNSNSSVTNAANCGTGTLKLHFQLENAMSETLPAVNYTDVVTLTLTPL